MKYIVQWAYGSSYGGPWQAGESVELEPDVAAQINIDSPGVLVEPKAPATRAPEEPTRHRQVKNPAAKRSSKQ